MHSIQDSVMNTTVIQDTQTAKMVNVLMVMGRSEKTTEKGTNEQNFER